MELKINAAKPVSYDEKAISKALDMDGCLIADIKYDSVRCHLVIKPTADINGQPAARAYAFSRTNKLIPALRELFSSDLEQIALGQLLSESLYPEGLVLDGEMMVKGCTFQEGAGKLRSNVQLPARWLQYILYGVVSLKHFIDKPSNEPFPVSNAVMHEQLKVVAQQVSELLPSLEWQLAESTFIFDMTELNTLYNKARNAGHEGLVVKRPFQLWHRGKKVGWWKVKPEDTIDGHVKDVIWGTVGKSNEGLVIGFSVALENGVTVAVDGLTNAMKREVTINVNRNPDFYKDWAVQAKFMEMTESGSLRHPKFDCWRGTDTDPTLKA